jgi:plasmid segregation protein ParM
MVDGFRFARGASKSIDFAMNSFYEKVAEKIPGADSQSLSLIEGVHKPTGERFYRPQGAKTPTNLDEFLPELRKNFAQEMSSRLVEWLPERVTDVIVTGGGGEFFWADFQPLLKEAKLKAHLAEPCRKANALGQYLYGEAQLANAANKPIKA